jgi:hypothetical protein
MKKESYNVFARQSEVDRVALPLKARNIWHWQASFCTELDANKYVDHYKPHHAWEWRITRSDGPKTHLS